MRDARVNETLQCFKKWASLLIKGKAAEGYHVQYITKAIESSGGRDPKLHDRCYITYIILRLLQVPRSQRIRSRLETNT